MVSRKKKKNENAKIQVKFVYFITKKYIYIYNF